MKDQQRLDPEDTRFPAILTTGKDQITSFALYGEPFSLVQSLHPIPCKVLTAAMDEIEARTGCVTRVEAERSLGSTLLPFARRFGKLDQDHHYEEEDALRTFGEMTKEWIFDQTASCVSAVVLAQLARYRVNATTELVSEDEWCHLAELRRLYESLPDQPALANQRQQLVEKFRDLAASVADRSSSSSPERPAVLSNLLSQTEHGRIKPIALAALVTKGNSSVGREHTQSAVQVLTPAETVELLNLKIDIKKKQVIDRISELRKKAAAAPHRIMPGCEVTRAENLWVRSLPGSGAKP